MKKLFLDTEFTDLVPHNKLISIALGTEDGKYFYAELTDTYEEKDCSEFVKEHVLPILKGGEYRMSRYECSLKIGNWIEEQGSCILACDNMSWDIPHLRSLLEPIWPDNLKKDEVFKFVIMDHITDHIVQLGNFKVHNALDDVSIMVIANNIGEAWEV